MYKNYIFDLYGTLVDIHTEEEKAEVWEKLSLFYGYYGARYSPEELRSAYKRLADCKESAGDSHEAYPEIQIEKVFRELYVEKGVQPEEALTLHTGQFFRALTTEYLRLYDGAAEMLGNLRKMGKKVYLLSNAQRIFTEYELYMLDIAKYFDGIFISSDYGVKKPDLCFFQALLESERLNPKECIMIGNDENADIAGASGAGMDSFYIHSNLSPEWSGKINATYVRMEMNLGDVCGTLGITAGKKPKRTAAEWKKIYADPEFQRAYTYEGHDLGVCCTESGTSFLIWSPCAEAVVLNLYADGSGGAAYQKIPMEKEEKGVWAYRTEQELHGVYYDYEVTVEGETAKTADPYAKACGINGQRSMAVNLSKTNPDGWQEDSAPEKPTENIIYELHVREFSWDRSGGFPEESRGTYKAFACQDTTLGNDGVRRTGCAYLKDLGVTHVQLMPVYDYGSVDEAGNREEFNWGYDPVNYNVPEGSYATDARNGEVRIREMKEMVQSLHRQGFRVIMDVVYNHTYHLDSWFQRTVPWYYYRVNEDGTASDGSACGNDTASERPMCANYILDSVLYWTKEYHIDGFRFDLMGLLDVELMNRIRRELDDRYGKGEKLLYGEPWAAARSAMEGGAKGALKENLFLLDEQIGIFCDNTRDAIKGSVFDADKTGFVNGASGLEEDILKSVGAWQNTEELAVKSPAQIITYISAHDNQTLWDKLANTVSDEEKRLRINKLAAAICMTCQGNLFFLSGEEFARTKNGQDNSYNAPVSLNRLDWKRAWEKRELVEYYKGLIALRKQLPGLCDKTANAWKRIRDTWTKPGAAGFTLDNTQENADTAWETLSVIYNSRAEKLRVVLPEGSWEVLADAGSSFQWKTPRTVSGQAYVEPHSALLLGRRGTEPK